MPKFVVEREIPGIGAWSAGQRQKAAEKSRAVLREIAGKALKQFRKVTLGLQNNFFPFLNGSQRDFSFVSTHDVE